MSNQIKAVAGVLSSERTVDWRRELSDIEKLLDRVLVIDGCRFSRDPCPDNLIDGDGCMDCSWDDKSRWRLSTNYEVKYFWQSICLPFPKLHLFNGVFTTSVSHKLLQRQPPSPILTNEYLDAKAGWISRRWTLSECVFFLLSLFRKPLGRQLTSRRLSECNQRMSYFFLSFPFI